MKLGKMIALTSILSCLVVGCSLTNRTNVVVHAETGDVVETVFEEKVYNYEDEGGVYVITLTSETDYKVEAQNLETGATLTLTGKYVIEDNKLVLYEGNSEDKFMTFIINNDGATLSEYVYVYPCQVITSEYEFGSIYVDLLEGEVGDLVTIHATPSLLCEVVKISVNGVALSANEDGNYTFRLVEGRNVISATFQVSNEQVADVLNLIKSLEGKTWEDLFTVENLIILITFMLVTIFGSGLLIQLLKNKNSNKQLADNVNQKFEEETLVAIQKVVKDFLEDKFGPSFDEISKEMKSLDTVARTMANCFLLSQENTPEARLAVAKELTKLAETRKDLAEEVKKIINSQKDEIIKTELEKQRAIEELEKENEQLLDNVNESSNSEGRY